MVLFVGFKITETVIDCVFMLPYMILNLCLQICLFMCPCVHAYYAHMFMLTQYVCMTVCVSGSYLCIFIFVCACVSLCVYICVCVYLRLCQCVCVCGGVICV